MLQVKSSAPYSSLVDMDHFVYFYVCIWAFNCWILFNFICWSVWPRGTFVVSFLLLVTPQGVKLIQLRDFLTAWAHSHACGRLRGPHFLISFLEEWQRWHRTSQEIRCACVCLFANLMVSSSLLLKRCQSSKDQGRFHVDGAIGI